MTNKTNRNTTSNTQKTKFETLLQKEKETKQKAEALKTAASDRDHYAWLNLKSGRISREDYRDIINDQKPYEEHEILMIEALYLHDAARYEFLIYALEEWKKAAAQFDGKPLGEKTKEKISQALREKNIYFYFDDHAINFGLLYYNEKDNTKYNSRDFNYNDNLRIYSKYNEPFLLNKNKININGTYHLPEKRALKGSYYDQAKRLYKKRQKLNKLKDQYNNEVELFNALTPLHYNRIDKAK